MLGWILAIVIGAVAGWLASIIMKTNAQQGLLMDIVVGIVGGIIGRFLADLIGIGGGDSLVMQLLLAVVGAVILLAIIKAVRGRM